MRRSGFVDTAGNLGPQDHVCWPYSDLAEFRTQACRFLTDGLFAGQRVLYVGSGDAGRMIDDLTSIVGLEAALASGRARVMSVETMYPDGAVVDPAEQVAVYADATEAALADGYTGLRVAAEVTMLVRTPEQLDAFARYEHLADRYMARRPFAAMCGFDRAVAGSRGTAELACMHPLAVTGSTPFLLHPAGTDEVTAVLSGELDVSASELFARAIRRVDLPGPGDEAVIDARELSFVDHHNLVELAAFLRQRGTPGVLRAVAGGPVHTLVRLLNLPGLRVRAV